jgi:hypothetical protein
MDIKNLNDVPSFITKDGSEIRELLAHRNSVIRNQSLAEARVPVGASTQEHYHVRTPMKFITSRMAQAESASAAKPAPSAPVRPWRFRRGANISFGTPALKRSGYFAAARRPMSMTTPSLRKAFDCRGGARVSRAQDV